MKRPAGIVFIAIVFCLLGIYLCSKSLLPFASGLSHYLSGKSDLDPEGFGFWETAVTVPFIFGVILLLTGWGLLRLNNWARFAAMFILFVTAGAELPLLAIGASHGSRLAVVGFLEFFLRLVAVWYLFKRPTADKFLPSRKVV